MDGSDECLVVNVQLPSRDDVCTFLDRLRGRYVIPIRDGAGPLNGKDEVARSFPVPPIAVASADLICVLALFAYTSSESPAELHDLSAALLQAPSLSHGCYSPEDMAVVIDEMLGRVPSAADEQAVDSKVGPPSCCPHCGSEHLGGLVSSFYVPINHNGSPRRDVRWESESEIGPERICYDCQSLF